MPCRDEFMGRKGLQQLAEDSYAGCRLNMCPLHSKYQPPLA